MQVQVKLLGVLSINFPSYRNFHYVEFKEGGTIRDLLEYLGVPFNEVHFISVNAKMQTQDYILKDGDKVIFFPQVSGG
ncbi:molybdopterin synthase sulfur carrier subunit [Desulforamulus putei DSM 12395]|uniref:Molybdopterin synthase sulfur carrier subunit n=1 Tax=Desulforamulus putei DSM 12395 TaxID=1121429 RepID=A0A1M5CJE4_9FIRM|nr:MoaD/ThiS family protein [Desulforamulus putei]SHF54839.1 molybdopterin synthase sulfur carrier subunit [Desulforamulus putei DSM 12395]